jgi:thiamine pyrophosphokinase
MNICYIIGAGEMSGEHFHPGQNDLVIAADGGYRYLQTFGIQPHLLVGDFDSLDTLPTDIEICRYPVMKDDTDTMLAIKIGLDQGYRQFRIFGGTGGRLDHTLANVQSLAYIAQHGGRGYLIGSGQNITVIKDSELRFNENASGILSVFTFSGPASGVFLEGLLYPLNDAVLQPDFPLAVSNHFTGIPATVRVQNGLLTVLWRGDIDKTLIWDYNE